MRQLRLPILALLAAVLLLASVPAAAATAGSSPATPGWMSHLLSHLLDALPWGLPVAAVREESATGAVPPPTDAPDDPTVQSEPDPHGSSESGALIDPDG